MDNTSAVTYSYDHDLIHQDRNGTFSYYHYDGLGSTRGLTDDVGDITDTWDFDVFGDIFGRTGETENNYLFTGEQYDESLDQYYLRARYYDQGIGRFTQMDTWQGVNAQPITLNKYLYANADPANGTDPSGNMTLAGKMAALGGLSILGAAAISNYNIFSLDRTASPGFDGVLSDREMGTLILLMMGNNVALWNMVFKEDGESDKEKMDAINSSTMEKYGDGKWKILSQCHVKRAGSPERTIGFVKGMGLGSSYLEAKTNAQASANARCVSGTQARHCDPKRCWKNGKEFKCHVGPN